MNNFEKITQEKIDKCIEALNDKLLSVRAQGANPMLLNGITVDYYGTMTPLNQLANIKTVNPTLLLVTPFDKGSVKNILKAISNSSLNLPSSEEGHEIRISVPPLVAEKRKEFVKNVKEYCEDAKVKMRGIRHDINKKIKNNDDLSDNEKELNLKKVQNYINNGNKIIDEIFKSKEKQLLNLN